MTKLDPILTKVLWNRLISIVDEAATGLIRTSYSIVVRDYYDFCVGLFDADGNMLAHSTKTTPGFIGMMPFVMKHFLKVYPAETTVEGDVIITNDPWLATGHLLDVTLATPIFYDGNLVGFAVCVVHHLDIGGRMSSIESKDMYEEGLKIPIMKLYEAGRRNEAVFSFLRANVRMAHKVIGDVGAQLTANKLCSDGLRRMIKDYGFADLKLLAQTIIGLAGASMRRRIAEFPNGTFRNAVTLPPIGSLKEGIDIRVAVVISGESVIVDYEGSSPTVEAALNVTLPFTTSYTTYAIKMAMDPDIPNNAGALAPITVKAPLGGVLNCVPPAPTWGRTIIAHNLPEIILGALAPAMPGRVIAASGSTPLSAMYFSGRNATGDEFLAIVSHMGGYGGGPVRDGYSSLSFPYNTASIPVEVTENDTCLLYLKKELSPDSAGPGHHRGGFGQEVVFTVPKGSHASPEPITALIRGSGRAPESTYPVFGREGGGPGQGTVLTLNGQSVVPGARHRLTGGDTVRLVLPGGGGFGDPLTRDPAAVEADVRAGLVTPNAALVDYGVVLGTDQRVDTAATKTARGARASHASFD